MELTKVVRRPLRLNAPKRQGHQDTPSPKEERILH